MRRKVIKQGHNTMTITLPRKWIRRNNITQGDELYIKEKNAGLEISKITNIISKQEQLLIDIKDSKEFLLQYFCGPYIKGYDSIKVRYGTPEQYNLIRKAVKYMLGFEIIEQTSRYVLIEEISTSTDDKFTTILLRMFHILKSFTSELKKFFLDPEKGNIKTLINIDLTLDRLNLYCRRLINKNLLHEEYRSNMSLYYIVCLVEQAGDELKLIIDEYLLKKKTQFRYDKRLDPFFDTIIQLIDNAFSMINNFLNSKNISTQITLSNKQDRLRKKIDKSIVKIIKRDNLFIFYHLLNMTLHFRHMSTELFSE